VVEDPTPVWYSPQPPTELQVPERVYPLPAVKVVDEASVLPTTTEPEVGDMDVTEVLDWLVVEPPVDERIPLELTPLISYIDTEPATVAPKEADIVSAPVLAAFAYQRYE